MKIAAFKERFSNLKWEIISLFSLFLISLALRLYLLIEFPHVVFLNEADAMAYFAIAKSIVNTWGLGDNCVHFPPFYPLLIAIVSVFTEDIEIAGRLTSSIMGALLVFPVYFIGKEIYGKRVGFLSSIAAIFLGPFVDLSLMPLSQATYLTLLTTGIYLGVVSIKTRSLPIYFLLGLTFGAVYLTRPEGFAGFVFIASVVSLALLFNGSINVKLKLKGISLMLSGFLIMSLPYINYLHNQTGTWTISGKTAATVIGIDASAKLLPSGKTVGESMKGKVGLGELFPTPQEFLKRYLVNMSKFGKVLSNHFPATYLILALMGLLSSILFILKEDGGQKKIKIFQSTVLLGSAATVLPVFAFSNLSLAVSYILPLFPVLLIWLSTGLVYLEDQLLKLITLTGFNSIERFRKWSLASTAVILFFSYSSIFPIWNELSSEDFKYSAASQKFFLKDTGRWLKYNTSKDSTIMSRWSNMAFYADRKWVYIPDGEIPEVVKYAKEHHVGFIVIDSNAVPRRRPKLAPLLNPTNYDGLRPVYAREEYWTRVIIYEVL